LWRIKEGHYNRKVKNAEMRFTRRRMRRAISTTEDSIEIPNLCNIPYSHGGFFGAAPFMLSVDRWLQILRQLMPDVYCEVARRVFSRSHYLIHWAENNPVCCAFGTIKSLGLEPPESNEDVFVTNPTLSEWKGAISTPGEGVEISPEEVRMDQN
jgi:hypothetical protein